MNSGENSKNYTARVLFLYVLLSGGAWIALIISRVCGTIRMSWIAVLLGAFWLPVLVLAFSLGNAALLVLAAHIKRQLRRKRTDRRIIRLAKALGAWNESPAALGGRALELKAWKGFKIKRQYGETDAELRIRIMASIAAKKHMEETAVRLERKLREPEEICATCWNKDCRDSEALRNSKVQTCILFTEGLIPDNAGEYVREDE